MKPQSIDGGGGDWIDGAGLGIDGGSPSLGGHDEF